MVLNKLSGNRSLADPAAVRNLTQNRRSVSLTLCPNMAGARVPRKKVNDADRDRP